MTELTNKRFAADLDGVCNQFLRMGGLVESMIIEAINVLATGDSESLDIVREREKQVNRLEVDIDSMIIEVLALHQPAAVDLRLLIAVSKMLTDLERSGDEAEIIAKGAIRLYDTHERFEPVVDVSHIGTAVQVMMHQMLDSFAHRDPVLAADVVRTDKKVDKEWKSTMRSLSSFMIEDPRKITDCIDMMFIARSLGRIGDHAKNMSERIIYIVQGEDVRHQGAKKAEAVASSTGNI